MNDLISLSQLFDKKIYRIPDYQRGYAWTDSQLEDFWDDLNNLTEDRYHYTGMLSLKKLDKSVWEKWEEERWIIKDKDYEAFHVVDGQQRLTTFIILVNSIIRFAKSHNIQYLNGDDLDTIKARYIVEYKKPEMINKAFKFGYESDNPSFEFLRYKILEEGNSGTLQETFYTLNLERAKSFFDKNIQEFFKEKGKDGLESLFKKLVNRLQFNIHNIDDDFDVFVAFETMNNRGKKLSNLEILKNRLIYLTTIYPENILSIDEKNQIRKNINDAWKEVYYQLGRNKEKPLNDDWYLRSHWSLFFKYSRNTGDDYINFLLGEYFTPKAVYGLQAHHKKELDDAIDFDEEESVVFSVDANDGMLTPTEISLYVESLKSVAQYWYYSYNPMECNLFSDEEKKWISKLNRVGINYYRTLVVASFLNKDVTTEQRVRLFKIMEKSLFVFFRMARWQSSYQSTVAYNFARELYKEDRTIGEIIDALENKFNSVVSEAVETFSTKIQGLFKNGDGYYSWADLRYFLFEYEMSLYEKTFVPKLTDWEAFTKSEKDKISIEHIFPQTPTKYYWKNQFRQYNSEEHHRLANSLGNLLALSQSVNSALQNDEFEDKKNPKTGKRRGYANGSHSEVEVSHYKDWNPECIKERGLKLLAFLEQRWSVKFDEDSKLKVLGIEFMSETRESIPELNPEDIYSVPELENSSQPLRDIIALKIKDILDVKEKEGQIYNIMSSNCYIRFAGVAMRNKVGFHGNGQWTNILDLVAYEIQNTIKDGVSIVVFIGPSDDQNLRLKWHNFAKNNEALGGKYRVTKKKWDPMIKTIVVANPRDTYISDEEYITTIIDGIKDFFDTRFIDIEEAFKDAPADLNNEIYNVDVEKQGKIKHYFKEIDFESSLTNKK
ncbi:MAG: DUF262 domain-containing protein [Acholeplasmatales bacterium]|nr:DUF262 domain-containing protein [Acholeplasmatales bacterium]